VIVAWRNPLSALPGLAARDARTGMVGPAIEERLTGTAAWPPPPLETFERAAWNTCARMTMMLDQADRNPDWHVVQHEDLCLDPIVAFRELFTRIGLDWSDDVAEYLEESDRPGEGFDTHRVTRDQLVAWQRLDPEQLTGAVIQMRRFLSIPSMASRMESSLAVLPERPAIIDLRERSKPRAKKRETGAARSPSSRRTMSPVSSPE
jgi:hypothetical protein